MSRPPDGWRSARREREQLVADFLSASAFADPEVARCCAELIVEFGCDYDGQPLRVSPSKIETFLFDWFADEPDPARVAALPAVVTTWVRWAGERAGLPAAALAELADAAEEFGAEFLDDGTDGDGTDGDGSDGDGSDGDGTDSPVLDCLLADLDEPPDYATLRAIVDRRLFAMPHGGTRIGGTAFADLDPGDEDDRQLLITGEHPEYHEALDEVTSEKLAVLVDGTNPRLHITMHELVANQLWHDDPAEAWQAAQRLTAAGVERHDVLHALGEVAMRHLHRALTDGIPVDGDAYCRDLAELGVAPEGWTLEHPAKTGTRERLR